ncbi:MAG: hypothetical protein D4R83_04075 [Streptomycetaceae bacterium]|nr:MAG: hypothetical protein D4R83_04075 [Streptomycetaceae bacterium]
MGSVSNIKPVDQIAFLRRLVLLTGLATTFIVWTSLADPINLPKFFVLTVLASWILGSSIAIVISRKEKFFGLGQWALIAFTFGVVLAGVLTDVRFEGFFGAEQRNNGAVSYLALAGLTFAGMTFFGPLSVKFFRSALLVVGIGLTLYGVIQTTGNDPLPWVLVYGPVIGTLGNPDFVSGLLGVSTIATMWIFFVKEEVWLRISAGVLLVFELFIISKTGSIQGFVAFSAGLTFLSLAKLWQTKRQLGMAGFVATGFAGLLVVLGLLNMGPLAPRIYQTTLRNRLDYWHAAINMFTAHPFSGVGLERFGENYFRYAPTVQIVPGQSTNNAHNVFMQLLATGGLIVIVPYLFLLGVIMWISLRGIAKSSGEAQVNLVAIFSIWLSLMLISAISIDNLGVAVWFWISGGVLYSVAKQVNGANADTSPPGKTGQQGKKTGSDKSSALAPIVALVSVVVALVFMVPAWKGSAELSRLSRNADGLNQQQYVAKIQEVAKIQPGNHQTLITLSQLALNAQASELGITLAKSTIEKDPQSYFGYQLLSFAYEQSGKYPEAITQRQQMLRLNPREKSNMLGIMQDYSLGKDLANAKLAAQSVITMFPTTGFEDVAVQYESFKDYTSAITYRLDGLKVDSKNLGSLVALTNDYAKTGKMAGALALIPRVSALDPKGAAEAAAFEYTNQWAKALPNRQLTADKNPNDPGSLLALATNFAKLGQMDKANPLIARIQQLKPGSDEAKAAQALTKG